MSLRSTAQVSSEKALSDQVFYELSKVALLQRERQSSYFLGVEVSFGMLTPQQDAVRHVYYVGIKYAISEDTGFVKSLSSRLALFWKAALIL